MSNGISFFNNHLLGLLEKKLNVSSLRNELITNNIANINTPGYKRSVVKFEEMLQKELGRQSPNLAVTNEKHITPQRTGTPDAQVLKDERTSMRQDGNNVDIDSEMSQLAMNTIDYNFTAQMINSKLSSLRFVINDGRR